MTAIAEVEVIVDIMIVGSSNTGTGKNNNQTSSRTIVTAIEC